MFFSSLIGIFSLTVEIAIDLYSSTIESAVLLLLFLHLSIYLFMQNNCIDLYTSTILVLLICIH